MKRLIVICLTLMPNLVMALTPKQYCEALEAKKSGSYEILNYSESVSCVSATSCPSIATIKLCKAGKFCINVSSILYPIDSSVGVSTRKCVEAVLSKNFSELQSEHCFMSADPKLKEYCL